MLNLCLPCVYLGKIAVIAVAIATTVSTAAAMWRVRSNTGDQAPGVYNEAVPQ